MPDWCYRIEDYCRLDTECEDCLHCYKYAQLQQEFADDYFDLEE